MPPSTIDAQIRARIESFTRELAELVKQAAVESVQEALSGTSTGRRTKKARGRPRSTKPAKRAVKPRSGRRSPAQVDAMAAKVLAHVKANQGHRLEEIGAALKVATKDLKRPVATLLDEKKVRTTGKARGTKYFAGGKRKKSGAKKKAGRKAPKRTGRKVTKKGSKRKAVRKAVRKILTKAKRKGAKRRTPKRVGKKRTTRKKATATVLATPIAT